MKIILKDESKIYIQKMDMDYLMKVRKDLSPLFYEETWKEKQLIQIVKSPALSKEESIVDFIKRDHAILDFRDFLLMSKNELEEKMELQEYRYSCRKDPISYQLYRLSMLNYVAKDMGDSSIFSLVKAMKDENYFRVDDSYVTYKTDVEGLYITQDPSFGMKIDYNLLGVIRKKLVEEEKKKKVGNYLSKSLVDTKTKSIWHVIREEKPKVYHK